MRSQRGGGAPPDLTPHVDTVDPPSCGDRDGPVEFTFSGSNLDGSTPQLNAVNPTGLNLNVEMSPGTPGDLTCTIDAAGTSSFGVKDFYLSFDDHDNSNTFQIEIQDN